MPIINEREANPPDKVFPTQTDNWVEIGEDKELVFDGPQGMAVFTAWINKSKQQGRDLTIECKRITFRHRQGGS